MVTYRAEIPYRAYWCTPFARWQGSFSHLNSVPFAAHVAREALAARGIDPGIFDHGVLGLTVPQHRSFYGVPWLMSMLGAPTVAGPTVMQACATSARALLSASEEIGNDMASASLVVTADRTSNGPHIYYPDPAGPGGTGDHEDWVLDSFSYDPNTSLGMIDTAENVAAERQISTTAQHDVVLRRHEQYRDALADEAAFLKRFMTLPFPVPDKRFAKTVKAIEGDEGVHPTTADGLGKLKPVKAEGTVTFGGQTHPADGNAAIVVATPEMARELSADPAIRVKILGFGQARTRSARMPEATVPAARRALAAAGLSIDQIDAIKSHNPFAVNDIVFAQETGADLNSMNNYGCSLIWGHPQAPTGLRLIIELIEELALRGGGRGLFHGCAAGDTAMSVVLSVEPGS